MGKECQDMPLGYVSYQIGLGRFEEAVETLEQGRALLWSEMRGLRAPLADLIEDLPLADRLAKINQELEEMTISVTSSRRPVMADSTAQGGDGIDPFGRLVVRRQKLVEERDILISDPRPTKVARNLECTIIYHSSLRRLAWTGNHYQPL